MQSLDAIIEGLQRQATSANLPVDVSMAAYDDLMAGRAAAPPEKACLMGDPAGMVNKDRFPAITEKVEPSAPRPRAASEPPAAAEPFSPEPPAAPLKKRARHSLLKLDDLADVQKRHDQQESNGSIAADYQVSDQTIINFLKANGNYHSTRGAKPRTRVEPASAQPSPAGKPEASPAPLYPKREDMLGDPMPVTAPPARASRQVKRDYTWQDGKFAGVLLPGDLMDVHDMLADGKTCADIAERYQVERQCIEAFILANQSAQMTRVKHTPPQAINNAAKPPPDNRKRKRKW